MTMSPQEGEGVDTLKVLLGQVREATKPSPKLHAELLAALIAPEGAFVEQSKFNGAWCIFTPAAGHSPQRLWELPRPFRSESADVTASVDAALALVEVSIPGAHVTIEVNEPYGEHRVHTAFVRSKGADESSAWACATPALAICAGLLSAILIDADEDAASDAA